MTLAEMGNIFEKSDTRRRPGSRRAYPRPWPGGALAAPSPPSVHGCPDRSAWRRPVKSFRKGRFAIHALGLELGLGQAANLREVCPLELGLNQVCILEIGPPKHRILEVGPHERGHALAAFYPQRPNDV